MLSQDQASGHGRRRSSSKKDPQNFQPSQTQVLYAIIAIMGIIILITRPFLIVFALLLVGYGRYYHIETHKKPHRPWSRENHSEHALHLGPSHDQRQDSLEDLAKGLNLPKWRIDREKKVRFGH